MSKPGHLRAGMLVSATKKELLCMFSGVYYFAQPHPLLSSLPTVSGDLALSITVQFAFLHCSLIP